MGECYGLCLKGVSSFVWRYVSPNLSLSESDCFRSAFVHLRLVAWVLMTYIKDAVSGAWQEGQEIHQQTIFIIFILLSNFGWLSFCCLYILEMFHGLGGIHYLSLDALGTFFFLFWYAFPLYHVLSCYLNKCFCMISWFYVSLYVAFPFLANLNRGS